MDFRALEYICAINEAKTISQAAKNLFISQPALSQYLKNIEQKIGVQFFERAGNAMVLTKAGEIVVRNAKTLLQSREEMLDQVSSLRKDYDETLRFGISPFYSKYYLPMILPYYRANYPNIRLSIVEKSSTELENYILNGDIDLCFIPAEPTREGLEYKSIYMEEIMIALPPNHYANNYSTPSSNIPYLDITLLANEPFVELNPTMKFSHMSQRILRHFSIAPDVIYESTSWDTVCMLVARGIGVGFLPAVLMHKHLHEPKFYRILNIESTRTYSAVYIKGKRLTNSEIALISVFKQLLQSQAHPYM